MRILFLPYLGILLLCGSVFAVNPVSTTAPATIDCSKLTIDQLTKEVLYDICDSAPHIAVDGGQTVPLDISDWSYEEIQPFLRAQTLAIYLKMYDNPTVRRLDFECTTCTSGVKNGVLLDVRNNKVLKRIAFDGLTSGLGTVRIDIRGNRLLEEEYITKLEGLSKGAGSYVQKAGDCYFDEPVKTAAEMKGCQGVSSDLILKDFKETKIPVGENSETSIRYLDGCLHVVNTRLVDLDFLSADVVAKKRCTAWRLNTEVSGNAALCVNELIRKQLGNSTVTNNKPEGCSTTCVISEPVTPTVAAELAGNVDVCTTLILENTPPELIITGHNSSSPTDKKNLEKLFKDTTSIGVPLVIENNQIDDFNVFPNLESVGSDTSAGEPTLIVRNNQMNAIDFPKLSAVNFTVVEEKKEAILFEDNGKFQLKEEQQKKFVELARAQSGTFKENGFDRSAEDEAVQNSTGNYPTEMTTEENSTKAPDGLGIGVIIGIVCGAVAAVAIVGGVVFCWRTNKLCFKKGGANNAAKTGSTDKTTTSASKDAEKGAGSAVDAHTPSKMADKTPEGSKEPDAAASASAEPTTPTTP